MFPLANGQCDDSVACSTRTASNFSTKSWTIFATFALFLLAQN
jgi:hypothetical protein